MESTTYTTSIFLQEAIYLKHYLLHCLLYKCRSYTVFRLCNWKCWSRLFEKMAVSEQSNQISINNNNNDLNWKKRKVINNYGNFREKKNFKKELLTALMEEAMFHPGRHTMCKKLDIQYTVSIYYDNMMF